jgi:hypothetical protein
MQTSPEYSSNSAHSSENVLQQPVHASTLVYEGVTLASMLLLLCTMWAF